MTYAVDAAILERFLDKVSPEPNSGCWLWLGATSRKGYGNMRVGDKTVSAYRLAYEMFRAPIPDGLEIDHKCNVRCCVNPAHLEPVTHLENVRRLWRRGRGVTWHSRATHCPKGHPYDGDNVFVNTNGARQCRQCKRERGRAQYAASVGRVVRRCKRKTPTA